MAADLRFRRQLGHAVVVCLRQIQIKEKTSGLRAQIAVLRREHSPKDRDLGVGSHGLHVPFLGCYVIRELRGS